MAVCSPVTTTPTNKSIDSMLTKLIQLAQTLDDRGLVAQAEKIDRLIAMATKDSQYKQSSSESFDPNDLREMLRRDREAKKLREQEELEEEPTQYLDEEEHESEMLTSHQLELDKQELVEDVAAILTSKLIEKPVDVENRAASLEHTIRLEFEDYSSVIISIVKKADSFFLRILINKGRGVVDLVTPIPELAGADFAETAASVAADRINQLSK